MNAVQPQENNSDYAISTLMRQSPAIISEYSTNFTEKIKTNPEEGSVFARMMAKEAKQRRDNQIIEHIWHRVDQLGPAKITFSANKSGIESLQKAIIEEVQKPGSDVVDPETDATPLAKMLFIMGAANSDELTGDPNLDQWIDKTIGDSPIELDTSEKRKVATDILNRSIFKRSLDASNRLLAQNEKSSYPLSADSLNVYADFKEAPEIPDNHRGRNYRFGE